MIDKFSDATEYGGLSHTELEHHKDFLRVKCRFQLIPEGFVLPSTVMFSGFKHEHLFKKEFDTYNGLRITMKPPMYPCKVGLHLKVAFGSEHELFVASIVDINNQVESDHLDWQTYEIPINLLQQHFQLENRLKAPFIDHFVTAGLVFLAESDKESVQVKEDKFDCHFDIKTVDVVANPQFDLLKRFYNLPVMVKLDDYERSK